MKVKYRKEEDNIPADYVSRIVENPDGTLEVRHIIAEDPVLSTPPEQYHSVLAGTKMNLHFTFLPNLNKLDTRHVMLRILVNTKLGKVLENIHLIF